MNPVNDLLPDYREPGYFHRLAKLFRGLRQPRDTRAYKEAVIETQRLSAPAAAFALPLLVAVLLMLMTASTPLDPGVTVTILDPADTDKPIILREPERKPVTEHPEDIDITVPFDSKTTNDFVEDPSPTAPQRNPAEFVMVRAIQSPTIFKDLAALPRGMGARGRLLADNGGSRETEAAVLRALRWLKKNQQPDGSWNRNKVAMTGLAVLTYLAHDERPGDSAEFGPTVERALDYLLAVQNKKTGRFPGNYDHPIATYALCEAFAMTRNPNVKAAALAALDPLLKGQHPTGGWTYNMDPGHDKETGAYRDDTSYMGWCVQALKAAKLAGLHPDGLDKACKLAVRGFKKNAAPGGGFGYTSPGAGGLTGVGTLCLQLLGAADEREVRKSLDLMAAWQPSFEAQNPLGGSPQYYCYYATQAKFHEYDRRWHAWNHAMTNLYLKAQQIERNAILDPQGRACDIGWWTNGDVHTDRPVMDTCLAALQLTVYYRYLPTTSVAAVHVEPDLRASAADPGDIPVDLPLNL